jgi:integrase
MTEYKSLGQIESTANIRRSVVYKDELDELVDKLAIEDKRNIKNLTDNNFLLVYKNVVFSLLLYYSGCRKNELRSRLVEDMMSIPSNEFSIDISKVGVRKLRKAEVDKGQDLKTAAAKRRVRFQILDDSHHAIVKRYLGIVEKKNYDFLFPAHNKVTFKIYKKKVISESSLDIIGKSLQEITKRYTPLHSLRHSYATNQLKYLYESKQSRVEDLFEISNKMGHRDPYVSISSYMHIDLLKLENILRY